MGMRLAVEPRFTVMVPDFPGALIFALVIALVPAVVRWWWGRPLAQMADDPVLPERLVALNTRVSSVAAGCAVVQIMVFSRHAAISLPLQILASTAAAYPLRKTLYQETWSLFGFFGFFGRLMLGVFGFWILLVTTPWLTSRAGEYDVIAGCALAGVLFAWSWYYGDVTRAILRTRAIEDPTLLERFEAVARRSRAPMPRFEYVAMRGGTFANALALPALRGSSVLFTDTLLKRLSPDEIVAICGHEIAHLEYYDRRRLLRLLAANVFLIVTAALLTPVSRLLVGRHYYGYAVMVFPIALVAALALRARHRQRNETDSDLRAVELTGDAEALASGLTALHAIARVPRRWDHRREQQATHPSLARRLHDIRAAAGTAATAPQTSPEFRDVAGPSCVAFEASHLRWQEGLASTHLLDYGSLNELRLHASPKGGVTLVAVQGARRWEMTPAEGDRAAMQAMLDTVDGRLAHEAPRAVFSAAIARLVIAMGGMIVLAGAQIVVGIIALVAAISATPALLNAAGCAALVAAALVLRDGPATVASLPMAVLVAGAGALFFVIARVRRGESSRLELPAMAGLAALALLASGAIVLGGLNPIRLHQGARALPAATVLFVALAAACWSRRQQSLFRHGSVAAALAASVMTAVSSTAFLDAAGNDPFLVVAPRATQRVAAATELSSFDVPFDIDSIRLSPGGTLLAMTESEEDDPQAGETPSFEIARPDGMLWPLEGSDLAFINERRLLVLVFTDEGAEVRDVTFDREPRARQVVTVPGIRSGTLAYVPAGDRWVVLGRDGQNRFVRAEGPVTTTNVTTTDWPATQATRGRWIDAFATRGTSALIVERHYDLRLGGLTPWFSLLRGLARNYPETTLARVDRGARIEAGVSVLDNSCTPGSFAIDRVICTSFDGTRSRIVAIDPATAAIAPVALLEGRFWISDAMAGGWLSGWWESAPAAVHLSTHDVVRPPRVNGEFVRSMAVNDAVVATVSRLDEGSRVRLYPLRAAAVAAKRAE